jgi:soluble lytic murein transglycosylase-like protein
MARVNELAALGRRSFANVPLGGWPAAKAAEVAGATTGAGAASAGAGAASAAGSAAASAMDPAQASLSGSLGGATSRGVFESAYAEAAEALGSPGASMYGRPESVHPASADPVTARPVISSALDWSGSTDELPNATPFAAEFTAAATRNGLPPRLLAAVADVETHFTTTSVSPAGAQGLMQFMPSTAAAMGVDPWNPTSAIDGAARLLSGHLRRFGTVGAALAAYNTGSGTVARAGGQVPASATRYVDQVMTRYRATTGVGQRQRLGVVPARSTSVNVNPLSIAGGSQ